MASKKKGAAKAGAPDTESVEAEPTTLVRVTNTREGAIHVGQISFPSGSSLHESAVFAAFPTAVSDALADMVAEGWLKFEGHDPGAMPEPVTPEPVAPVVDPLPTLEAVAASTSAAELDAWFGLPGLSADLSNAILARHSALSPA
jgi:hypothetical protein